MKPSLTHATAAASVISRRRFLAAGRGRRVVTAGSAGESAGIKAGDVLVSWVRAANPPANPTEARGAINSFFDLTDVETEQAPRGPVTLTGTRDGRTITATFPSGVWRLTVRPQMPDALLKAYTEGKALIAAKEIEPGVARWRAAAKQALAPDAAAAAWLFLRAANALADARK